MIHARLNGWVGAFRLDTSFSVPATGITALFGPSGCGKTTLLRCLAGLARLRDAELRVGEMVWQDEKSFLPPHRRPVGYVFQEPRLFPHMSVLDNLRYGLRRVPATARQTGLESVIALMGVGDLLHRSPEMLSGGERQRVAIGRAILAQPRLLLMDEPLSALDRDAKNEILPYLEKLSESCAIPIIYVSHFFSEIERLAEYLVLMERGGRVRAAGKLNALLTDMSLPLARQPEAAVILAVSVEHYDENYDLTTCALGGVRISVPGHLGPRGSRHRLRLLASDISLVKGKAPDTSVLNILRARILSAETVSASQVLVLLSLQGAECGARLLASITRKSWDHLGLRPGDYVLAQVKGMALADAR